ncbi:MAG: hypothetical protein M1821_006381 [Bathelium mastoideum]|nr:MAG: hypothetical protein M1821_006381 [Bathelium mastoideum]
MEAVGAGSALLAFIGLGLTCTKSLYQVLSGYRDGPEQVKALASAIKDLETILMQLQSCRALLDSQADLENIKTLIEACNQDLLRYQRSLQKLQPNPNAAKVKQAWKRLTAAFDEKPFKQIWTEVNYHCQALGFQLQLLQSETVLTSERRIVDISNALAENNAHETSQSALLQQHTLGISTIHGDFKDLKDSMFDSIQTAVESLKEKIGLSSGMSQQQNDNTIELLTAIQAQISTQATQLPFRGGVQHSAKCAPAEAAEMDLEENDLNCVTAIQKLSSLIEGKEGVIYNEEADAVIDELASFLQNASKDGSLDHDS